MSYAVEVLPNSSAWELGEIIGQDVRLRLDPGIYPVVVDGDWVTADLPGKVRWAWDGSGLKPGDRVTYSFIQSTIQGFDFLIKMGAHQIKGARLIRLTLDKPPAVV